MADLEQFRAETRAWLEANCPASMRTPMVEEEVVWGGRNQKFVNPDSKVCLLYTSCFSRVIPATTSGHGSSRRQPSAR